MAMRLQKSILLVAFAAALTPAFSQDSPGPTPSSGGWRRFGDSLPADSTSTPTSTIPDYEPQTRTSVQTPPYSAPSYQAPGDLTLAPGSWITVHINEPLSSDHNQQGDTFTATLAQPVVANGFVIARRGQTVLGRVVSATRAGRTRGTSELGIELTSLSLVDGQQVPIRTQYINRQGGTSHGNDAGAIAAGTGIGAAIGAAADGGFGAGMGAIAGAAASTIAVLSTRGHATEVYPESQLTFRVEAPVFVSTARAEQAFLPVRQGDYEQHTLQSRPPVRVVSPPPYYGGYYGGYYGPGAYYYPGFYGSSLFFYSGPRYYGGYRGGFRGYRR